MWRNRQQSFSLRQSFLDEFVLSHQAMYSNSPIQDGGVLVVQLGWSLGGGGKGGGQSLTAIQATTVAKGVGDISAWQFPACMAMYTWPISSSLKAFSRYRTDN